MPYLGTTRSGNISRASEQDKRAVQRPICEETSRTAGDPLDGLPRKPPLAHVDDRTLTSVMGRIHEYGDRRLPLPGALGITAAALAAITAAIAGPAGPRPPQPPRRPPRPSG